MLLDVETPKLSDPREVGLLRELVLGVLRRRGRLDAALESLSGRSLDAIDVVLLPALRIGLYSLFFLDRTPAFAAVHAAVDLVPPRAGRGARGFVNAVLREAERRGADCLPPAPAEGDIAGLARYQSHPRWWVEALVGRLGWPQSVQLLEANNAPAATTLRPHPGRLDREALLERCRQAGLDPRPGRFSPLAVRLAAGGVGAIPGWAGGDFWIQDEASQLVAEMATGPSPVWDACAAPGGKTLALVAAGCEVLATDRHAGRIEAMRRRLSHHGWGDRRVELRQADASEVAATLGTFATVLLDAPCSGSGTLRRHPELRWRLDPEGVQRLAKAQQRLVEAVAKAVRPGGLLVYSVCSIEPREGPELLQAFLEQHPQFSLEPPDFELAAARGLVREGALATDSAPDELDGFFAARLRRAGS